MLGIVLENDISGTSQSSCINARCSPDRPGDKLVCFMVSELSDRWFFILR